MKRQFDEVNYEMKDVRFLAGCAIPEPLGGDILQAGV